MEAGSQELRATDAAIGTEDASEPSRKVPRAFLIVRYNERAPPWLKPPTANRMPEGKRG